MGPITSFVAPPHHHLSDHTLGVIILSWFTMFIMFHMVYHATIFPLIRLTVIRSEERGRYEIITVSPVELLVCFGPQ